MRVWAQARARTTGDQPQAAPRAQATRSRASASKLEATHPRPRVPLPTAATRSSTTGGARLPATRGGWAATPLAADVGSRRVRSRMTSTRPGCASRCARRTSSPRTDESCDPCRRRSGAGSGLAKCATGSRESTPGSRGRCGRGRGAPRPRRQRAAETRSLPSSPAGIRARRTTGRLRPRWPRHPRSRGSPATRRTTLPISTTRRRTTPSLGARFPSGSLPRERRSARSVSKSARFSSRSGGRSRSKRRLSSCSSLGSFR